jgi:hypothetical protein
MTILDPKSLPAKPFKLHSPYQELSRPAVPPLPSRDRVDIFC